MARTAAAPRHPAGCRDLTKLGHVPALDGLRGVAVAAVLLFHGGVSWAPGGFLGVDVFFVLSGFLITTILLEEADDRGGVSLGAFWARRARRLIPALVVVCIVAVVAAPWISEARSASSVRLDAASALAYVANWRFIFTDTAYFARAAGPSPLEHTWSLGVEEQFYVVWPLVAVALLRGPRWRVGAVALAGGTASIGAMALVFTAGSDTSRAYFGTDARVHVVLLGCVAAVLVHAWRRDGLAVDGATRGGLLVGAIAGAALLAGAIVTTTGDAEWLYRGGFALVAIGTAFVIAEVVMVHEGVAARLLSILPMRALGWISYGAYLWHWPIYLYLTSERTGLDGGALLGARLAGTIAVATASAILIENPIRRGNFLRERRALLALPAVALVVAAGLAFDGMRLRVDDPDVAAAQPIVPPPLPVAAGEPLRVLVVGDSVAETIALWTRDAARREGIAITEHAVLGCGIARGGPYRYFGSIEQQPPKCEDWPERWASVRAAERPHVVLLVVGRWEVMDRMHQGTWRHVGDPTFDAYLASELDRAVEVLIADGARLALATTPYFRRGERPDGGLWPEDEEARVDRFNEIVRDVVASHPGTVTAVELNAKTTDAPGQYARSVDGVRLRSDGVHFTREGGRFLGPWLLPQLRALVAPPAS